MYSDGLSQEELNRRAYRMGHELVDLMKQMGAEFEYSIRTYAGYCETYNYLEAANAALERIKHQK